MKANQSDLVDPSLDFPPCNLNGLEYALSPQNTNKQEQSPCLRNLGNYSCGVHSIPKEYEKKNFLKRSLSKESSRKNICLGASYVIRGPEDGAKDEERVQCKAPRFCYLLQCIYEADHKLSFYYCSNEALKLQNRIHLNTICQLNRKLQLACELISTFSKKIMQIQVRLELRTNEMIDYLTEQRSLDTGEDTKSLHLAPLQFFKNEQQNIGHKCGNLESQCPTSLERCSLYLQSPNLEGEIDGDISSFSDSYEFLNFD